ncbi:hypothetical protein PIB30_057767 [Stylosanthes scabra]|uniref:Trichome birefringence-like N-terminal domain-containing protein n=2 Tax=Stylosanthes scabra TaxID=79078 RepID=A0ABU6QJN3_9FABA|nr:hypothetical protein [Stylosanthes scabra]
MKLEGGTEILKCNYVAATRNIPRASEIFATSLESKEERARLSSCNVFSGNWTPYMKGPYYSNETCPFITDKQNCLLHGRPNREFLQWRWKPDECQLPLFDAKQFLKMVKGKSMAFVGDSIGRNQMESLICLLSTVARPEDNTVKHGLDRTYFRWWFYPDHNFTLALLWSPFLVKSSEGYYNDSSNFLLPENLYLHEPDQAWVSKIEDFDIVIFSGGQWFFRPLTYIEHGQVVGCQKCQNNTDLDFYGYRIAHRTAFRTILNLKGFKGMIFVVTHSPNHFENGLWNNGGMCNRTKPLTTVEEKAAMHPYGLEKLHQMQREEFREAEKEAKKKGLHFDLMDITEAMVVRPDGHPNSYWHASDKNITGNDCVHWCMPGPDTWNEILLFKMKNMDLIN